MKKNKTHFPMLQDQISEESITTANGFYDFEHFSAHEHQTIFDIIEEVLNKYKRKFRAMGLVNEAQNTVYKPRYVIFDIAIALYKDSTKEWDILAVSLAYESKGAQHRKEAIEYFEKVEAFVDKQKTIPFFRYSKSAIYTKILALYEKEHRYEKAIEYALKIIEIGDLNSIYFFNKIEELKTKMKANKPKRSRKMPDHQIEMEKRCMNAAKWFIREYWK